MTGTVHIVGAGPGDPELMTVKARRLLESADLVLHDNLVGDGVVEAIPDRVEVRSVGKEPGGDRTPQRRINHAMRRAAAAGRDVVRLKGGDPTVFGRGGEEAAFLAADGVPFEIVPGVSSATAAPASADIPATHRAHASSLTVVTGHEDPSKEESALDWDALADLVVAGGTLLILMGVGRLPDNVVALRRGGVPADTPVAMVEQATLDDEYAVTATLDTVAGRVERTGIEPPAVTVVGDVVGVKDRIERAIGTGVAEGDDLREPGVGATDGGDIRLADAEREVSGRRG